MGRRGKLPALKPGVPAPVLGPVPPPPSWLGDIARAEYERVSREKQDITAADAGLLASYAQSYGEVATHTQQLVTEGYTIKGDRGAVLNPRVRALDRARVGLLAAASALGLTPVSRVRSGATGADADDSADAFGKEHGDDPA